jgi:ABC transport system ATP-binding/permease protein
VVLLAEPNVLILDEPTNDLDTDMLAAIEDLLDSWPGTLLVVSHDRYLVERVTDHQFAVLDGRLRHLPGGIEEYLRLRAVQDSSPRPILEPVETASGAKKERLDRKKIDRLERQIEKLSAREAELEKEMVEAATEPDRLMPLDAEHREVVARRQRTEDAWLALTT